MYRRALTGYEKALGADHTSTLNTVNGFCTALVSCAYKANFQSTVVESSLELNRLLQLPYIWGSQVPILFGALGRALLWTLDEDNARTAFQQQKLSSHLCLSDASLGQHESMPWSTQCCKTSLRTASSILGHCLLSWQASHNVHASDIEKIVQ